MNLEKSQKATTIQHTYSQILMIVIRDQRRDQLLILRIIQHLIVYTASRILFHLRPEILIICQLIQTTILRLSITKSRGVLCRSKNLYTQHRVKSKSSQGGPIQSDIPRQRLTVIWSCRFQVIAMNFDNFKPTNIFAIFILIVS